jgi:hypothetical protein
VLQICHVQIGVVITNSKPKIADDSKFIKQWNYLLDFEFNVNELSKEYRVLDDDEFWVKKQFDLNEKAYLISTTHPTKRAAKKRVDPDMEYRLWCAGLWKAIREITYDQYEVKTELEKFEGDNSDPTYVAALKGSKKAYEEYHSESNVEPAYSEFPWDKYNDEQKIILMKAIGVEPKKIGQMEVASYSDEDVLKLENMLLFRKMNAYARPITSNFDGSKIIIFLYNVEKYPEPEYRLDSKNNITNNFFSKYGEFIPKKNYFKKELEPVNSWSLKWRRWNNYVKEYQYPFHSKIKF